MAIQAAQLTNQRFFPIPPQEVPKTRLVEPWKIRACKSFHEVLRMQFNESLVKRNQEWWARACGYTKGIWNRILNADQFEETGDNSWKRHLNPELIPQILNDTTNMAIVQWLIKDTPYKLALKTAEERNEETEQEKLLREEEALQARLATVHAKLRAGAQ